MTSQAREVTFDDEERKLPRKNVKRKNVAEGDQVKKKNPQERYKELIVKNIQENMKQLTDCYEKQTELLGLISIEIDEISTFS